MSDAAPPSWVKRARGLSAAHKFMLTVLWGYGPYAKPELWVTIDGDRQPRQLARCWESCAVLAELTAQPEATVRNQLRRLAADGWILRGKGSMRTLAWRAPGVFAYGAVATEGQPLATGDPGHTCTPPGHTRPPPGHECTPKVAFSGPQTFQEPSNSTSTNVDDAGARPDTPSPLDPVPLWTDADHAAFAGYNPDTPAPEHIPVDCVLHPELVAVDCEMCAGKPAFYNCAKCGFDGAYMVPRNPAPEEHTHGDTRPDNQNRLAVQRQDQGRRAVPAMGDLPAPGVLAASPRPAHVEAVHARATGDDTRGARGHRGGGDEPGADAGGLRGRTRPLGARAAAAQPRLTPELAEAVAAAGDVWAVQLGQAHFEKCVRETVDDLGLTPGDLTKGLLGWETMDRAARPPRSGWLYSRNRRAFKAAAGLGEVVAFKPLHGGELGVAEVKLPPWKRPGFKGKARTS